MDTFGLLAAVLLAAVVTWLLVRGVDQPDHHRRDTSPLPPDHLDDLADRLTGNPLRDRPLQNRVLALGPGVLNPVINALAEIVADSEGPHPTRLAAVEELIADFGLAAVGPITDRLMRLQPTAPLAASLTRVLRRLGQPGVQAVFARGLDQPELAPFLPRFRSVGAARDPGAALSAALVSRQRTPRAEDLEVVAGLLADLPEVQDDLWRAWDPAGRAMLLRWLCDWPGLTTPARVRLGLADPADGVRAAAARLARLCLDASGVPGLVAVACNDALPAARDALIALASRAEPEAQAAFEAAFAHPDAARCEAALTALALARAAGHTAQPWPEALAERADLDPRVRTWLALPSDPSPLLAALEDPAVNLRCLAATLLACTLGRDPRARERLLRLADAERGPLRNTAIVALAAAGDDTVADVLARALRDAEQPEEQFALQCAARRLGTAVVGPLTRRLRAEQARPTLRLLAALRAVPLAGAVPALLRALEEARSGVVEGALTATLRSGGAEAREAIDAGLAHPARGLLAPALRYLACLGHPDDLPLLMTLYDRHPSMRSLVLNVIETQGPAALLALNLRIAAGGDDPVLLPLEQRRTLLRACLPEGTPEVATPTNPPARAPAGRPSGEFVVVSADGAREPTPGGLTESAKTDSAPPADLS
jgi:hypothetical protein